ALVHEELDRLRPVVRADAGGDAEARVPVDADGERGALDVRVLLDHGRQGEGVGALGRERDADQATPVRGHEIDDLRGDLRGGADEVALVLAVLVVGDDVHPAFANVLDRGFDGIERHAFLPSGPAAGPHAAPARAVRERWCTTNFPIMSPSRFTASPGFRSRSAVWSQV